MNSKMIAPFALLGVIVFALIVFTGRRIVDSSDGDPAHAAGSPANEAGEEQPPLSSPSPAARGMARTAADTRLPQRELSESEIQASMEKETRELDAEFAAEPLNAAWAQDKEGALSKLLDPARLAKSGLIAPKDFNVRCHSQTCRVRLFFQQNDPAIDVTLSDLLREAGGILPNARIVPRRLPDGSIEFHMWVSANSAH